MKFGPQSEKRFRHVLRKARKGVNEQPTILPPWWTKEDDKICQEAEILHERFQKADAKALYGAEEFQNLRVLAELVLGTPIGAGIPREAELDIFKDKQGVYWHDVDPAVDTVQKPPSKGKNKSTRRSCQKKDRGGVRLRRQRTQIKINDIF